jgi:hypothetical protein
MKADNRWKLRRWVADQKHQFARGSIFIPSAQPKSALVATLFDPASADSLLSWGLFNQAFERKEYMEAYVAEDVARDNWPPIRNYVSNSNKNCAATRHLPKTLQHAWNSSRAATAPGIRLISNIRSTKQRKFRKTEM